MYCESCGKQISGKFCSGCGKDCKKEEEGTKLKSFNEFVKERSKTRTTILPKKRKLDLRLVKETTIFASILHREADGSLKQMKGSRLPIKVNTDWGPHPLKEAVFENFQRYNKSLALNTIHNFKLVYKDGDLIRFIPGTKIDFTVKGYKEDLGIGYSAIVVYLLEYFTDSNDNDDDSNELPDISGMINRYI